MGRLNRVLRVIGSVAAVDWVSLRWGRSGRCLDVGAESAEKEVLSSLLEVAVVSALACTRSWVGMAQVVGLTVLMLLLCTKGQIVQTAVVLVRSLLTV